jgi:hypothetical protein
MPERVAADLTEMERSILASGLLEWGGPASPTDDLARVLGFDDVRALYDQGRALAMSLRAGEPLTPADWRRALLATELAFASDVLGSGVDWSTTTGWRDDETIGYLRNIQRKLAPIAREA